MYLFTEYQTRNSGAVGQADPANIVVRDGVQYVNPQTGGILLSNLASQCIDDARIETSAVSETGAVTTFTLRTQGLGTAKVDGAACNESAIERLRREGWIVMVDMTTASPVGMWLRITKDPTAPAEAAAEGTDYAVLDLKPAVLKAEEKPETTTILLGAAAGGALGLVTAGAVGAVGGAVGGALIANWLA